MQDRIKDLESVVALAAALIIISVVFNIVLLIYISLFLLISSLIMKTITSRVMCAWLTLSHALGSLNSKFILTIIFFCVLTPIAIVYRLVVKDPLQLRGNKSAKSYYRTRNHLFEKKDFEVPW